MIELLNITYQEKTQAEKYLTCIRSDWWEHRGVDLKTTLKNLYDCNIKRIYVGSFNVLPDPLKLFTFGGYPIFEQKCLK